METSELEMARAALVGREPKPEEEEIPSPPTLEGFLEEMREEYERTRRELKEIEVLIRQSTTEVDKLSQRNAQITNKLRQVEANIDTYPRQDIKNIYSAAQEAQMRLFMMRNQVEQLQSKQSTLERYAQQLERFLGFSDKISSMLPADSTLAPELNRQQPIAHIIEAQESERRHLARQMHDGPAQALTNLILQAEICERLFDTDPARARVELNNLKNAVNATFQKTRDFIFDLRPMILDDLGLIPALKRYVKDFESKSSISTNLHIVGQDTRLPSHVEVTIFRIIQTLLSNVQEHAHATSVYINVDLQPKSILVVVEDDGSGFNVEDTLASAEQRRAMGLATMRERVEMLNGSLQIESRIGRGTKVRLEIPIA